MIESQAVGINFTGREFALEMEELESTVPASEARAWCGISFHADMDIKAGVIVVEDPKGLAIGDFWLFDD